MMWMNVDAALTEVPVNVMSLIDDTDFKTREESVVYNQAGMDLVWEFTTPAGVTTQTSVTPTSGGDYDWTNQGNGMYTIGIPASGGASINNDTEGFGQFIGYATGILPWRGPIIGFRAGGLNDLLIEDAFEATRGTAGTALPAVVAGGAGGLPVSAAGGLAMDGLAKEASLFDPSTTEVTTDAASRTASKADVSGLSTTVDLAAHDGNLAVVAAAMALEATLQLVKTQVDKMNFTGSDIKATLDGEEVVTDAASRVASKADVSLLALEASLFDPATDEVDVGKILGVALGAKVGSNVDVFFQNAGADTTKVVDDVGSGGGGDATAAKQDEIIAMAQADPYVDVTTSPWELQWRTKGTGTILFKKKLYEADGTAIVAASQLIGRQVHTA